MYSCSAWTSKAALRRKLHRGLARWRSHVPSCGNLVSVVEVNERRVPSLNLEMLLAKDAADDIGRLLGVERRVGVAVRHKLGVVNTATRAGRQQSAGTENTSGFSERVPRLVEVVQHPQHHDGADAAVPHG
jgi:hypothetical protein